MRPIRERDRQHELMLRYGPCRWRNATAGRDRVGADVVADGIGIGCSFAATSQVWHSRRGRRLGVPRVGLRADEKGYHRVFRTLGRLIALTVAVVG